MSKLRKSTYLNVRWFFVPFLMLKLYLRKSLTCEFLWLLDFCSWWVAPLILKVPEIAANQRWRGSESRWRPRSCWPAQRRNSSASSSSRARSTSDRPAMISSVFNLTKSSDERASILIQFKIYNIFHKKQLQFWFSFTFLIPSTRNNCNCNWPNFKRTKSIPIYTIYSVTIIDN